MSRQVDQLEAILGPRGRLRSAVEGWEPRDPQLEMSRAVARCLRDRRPLIVEAGTGTGKTLAYLVPALQSGLKVIVSTGTKNLQEQILRRDVPLLERTLPAPFTVAVLKGLSNYLCIRRWREHRAGQLSLGTGGRALDQVDDWAQTTETGDRAELGSLPDEAPLWSEISATSETRLGARCPCYDDCFVTRARRAAQAADLVVVNHHLFFADLTLRAEWPQAQLLPPYEAVIFDEAHQVEDVATDYFSVTVSTLRLLGLLRDLRHAAAAGQVDPRHLAAVDHTERVGEGLFAILRGRLAATGRSVLGEGFWSGEAGEWLKLDASLEELEGAASRPASAEPEAAEVCRGLQRRARSLRDDLAFIADHADQGRVYWGETRGRTVMLHASPVDVSEHIATMVVKPIESVVFTSATLTAGGSFEYTRRRLGLDPADELRLSSPFDYARQALLYLPTDLPEPSDPRFTDAVADRMERLVTASGGRAFLLFTSTRQMNEVSRRLCGRLAVPTLVQGTRPKPLLLEEFRREPSVLLATASFWEGVDVVGEMLQLVVIDKLPFAPPDDPLVAARCRLLEEQGRAPFADYQIPQAALQLAQGFGRLIRHRDDRGLVALLDRRATTRRYGPQVLSSLPRACPRTDSLAEAERFLAALPRVRG